MTTLAPDPFSFDWRAARDKGIAQAEAGAPLNFKADALKFVVSFLRTHGEQSGEVITDAVWNAGIVARDRRAMGSVFQTLIKDGLIEKCGSCKRLRGHGTSGGSLYRITK